jgi:hypothetical protein
MIAAAGGPKCYFGDNTSTYQTQSQRTASVPSLAEARRGDIVQWGGGAGDTLLHTAIITAAGSNPSLIDSNWGNKEQVYRGTFSARNIASSVYRIWRVGKVTGDNPRGAYDVADSRQPGTVRVAGWAYDPNAPTSPISIHVYIGGTAGSGAEGHNIGAADNYPPDVGPAFPGVGNYHG